MLMNMSMNMKRAEVIEGDWSLIPAEWLLKVMIPSLTLKR